MDRSTASSRVEFVRSTQKQQDSWRLAATSKKPRNLFGLESNELAQKSDPICACTATVITLVDILVSTKTSYFKVNLTPDRGSTTLSRLRLTLKLDVLVKSDLSTSVITVAVPARFFWLIRSIQDQIDFADFCWWQ